MLGGGPERMEPVGLDELDRLLERGRRGDRRARARRARRAATSPAAATSRTGSSPVTGDDLPRDRPIVTICESGARAAVAASILAAKGIDARPVLDGGIDRLGRARRPGRRVPPLRRLNASHGALGEERLGLADEARRADRAVERERLLKLGVGLAPRVPPRAASPPRAAGRRPRRRGSRSTRRSPPRADSPGAGSATAAWIQGDARSTRAPPGEGTSSASPSSSTSASTLGAVVGPAGEVSEPSSSTRLRASSRSPVAAARQARVSNATSTSGGSATPPASIERRGCVLRCAVTSSARASRIVARAPGAATARCGCGSRRRSRHSFAIACDLVPAPWKNRMSARFDFAKAIAEGEAEALRRAAALVASAPRRAGRP